MPRNNRKTRGGSRDGRLEHFNLYENVIRITDHKLKRIVDVDYRNGEMYCEVCETTECIHTGYAWSIYQRYTAKGTHERLTL
ncbi:hypothetical protein B9Q03_10880 [Candidatus Marsarchaeota G2 archaeon OSP_D]|uniref:Uncharacterized protein n=6 Tax=Candidatus Marsarchaeota group 2 TaxID=2203771 RepID=A0A2R6BCM0_9ARCH|nr:MAG: hypothetical protein B9Q03_10880 [Candidatus Marsarchaeota G2 archaeon OSP_D]PSN89874.1 MAG: hypothetical protein B9Q08_06005 [Candidatus Marsarchaeota G2 archaeon ECH_B_SAG-M15]PSN95173.1 MAG: hypothetical protein B9Q09_03365 [Candidatus Marsarchaeota G2 archaeon ECH_B_SAG-C16]PSN96390.1 MAG: hypothetical protein B9Q06_01805 [Candidatus Marsarchaeota G2 archaeon ECH_B_2]PSO01058.1 MAG: hypothetical protein B9Q07_01145 [Candidatus Marsarchaeota G2 archaeon ECH_B_3]PSO03056.1 MAG: hypot